MDTYWLHWQRDGNKFFLIDWQQNEHGEHAARCFWPRMWASELKGTVLVECEESGEAISRDIENQELPGLDLSKLPFQNVHITATPQHSESVGDYIECVYQVKEK